MNLGSFLPWVVSFFAIGLLLFLVIWKKSKKGSDQSLSLFQQQITSLQEQLRISLEASTARISEYLQQQSGQRQQTVGERLDNVSQTVGQRLDNAARVVMQLDQRMGKVEEATKRVFEVGQDIASLQEILRAPKLRGNLGEQFLGDLLAQMLPQDAYALQHSFKDGERVDAIIRTAHGFVPVDAKFPLENFQRLISASTDEDRMKCRKLFVSDVKKHVSDIAKKYIRPGEGTFDFALMYVPAENVYYEIIAREENLGEEASSAALALKKQVIPVSPNTFYAYLHTILLGLRGMRVEKFAKEILNDMGRIRTEVKNFTDEFATIGKHLSNATSAYGKAEKRLTRIDDRLQQFENQPEKALALDEKKEEGPSLYLNS